MAQGTKDEAHHDDHGTGRYWKIYGILLVFTALTVWTGRMDLGVMNIWVAMAIATTKATLVALFFMHLYDGGGINRLVFSVSILFVFVLLLGIFGDLWTRSPLTLPNGGPVPFSGAHAPSDSHSPPAPGH